MAEKKAGKVLKVLRSDNGGEYVSAEFERYLRCEGIVHQRTAPHTPEHNGVAERCNRSVMEMARAMLHNARLDLKFWPDAVATATYLKNRSAHQALEGVTPEEVWSGKKPDVSHLHVFGCTGYVHVPKKERSKLDVKARACIFLGYVSDSASGEKVFKLFCPQNNKFLTSRNVLFIDEEIRRTAPSESISELSVAPVSVETGVVIEPVVESVTEPVKKPVILVEPVIKPTADDERAAADGSVDMMDEQQSVEVDREHLAEAAPEESQGYSLRKKINPPREWWIVGRDRDHASVALISASTEPTSVREALASPAAAQWKAAIEEELQSMITNQVYDLVELPPGRKAVGSKWIFKVKEGPDGSIDRYKARLVAQGFSQTAGVDFKETFAPVAKFTSIRVVLALAAAMQMTVHQMDVRTAFLNGELDEEIYMKQPEGTVKPGKEHLVWKLKRALYGLKQAPRMWNKRLDQFLSSKQFVRCEADHSVYVRPASKGGSKPLVIAVYVDDLLVVGEPDDVVKCKKELAEEFDMKDLGEVCWLLGVEVTRVRNQFQLSQQKYVNDVLERFGMSDCRPLATPMTPGEHLTQDGAGTGDVLDEEGSRVYRSAVGSLMYLAVGTRPDIAAAVGNVSRFMQSPKNMHWIAVKRIFRYLKGTSDYVLCLGGENDGEGPVLSGYCDADWAGNQDDRHSTTGYSFSLGTGSVSWSSKRQKTVALSTTEAEYMSVSAAAREAVWLRQLLCELGAEQVGATTLLNDNQGCVKLTRNPVMHSNSKHIDVRHHYVRELQEAGKVNVEYCPTGQMAADVLTKGLARELHERCTRKLGIRKPLETQDSSRTAEVGVLRYVSNQLTR